MASARNTPINAGFLQSCLLCKSIHPFFFRIRYGHYHTIRQTDNAFIFRGNRFLMHTQFVRTVRFFHICFSIADHQNIRGFSFGIFNFLQSAAVTGNRFHTLLPLSSPPQKLPVPSGKIPDAQYNKTDTKKRTDKNHIFFAKFLCILCDLSQIIKTFTFRKFYHKQFSNHIRGSRKMHHRIV